MHQLTAAVIPATTVRDLGILIDADLSMQYSTFNGRTMPAALQFCGNFIAYDDQFHSSVFQTLVVILEMSRLDYDNATPAGLPTNLINRLLNAAARSFAIFDDQTI